MGQPSALRNYEPLYTVLRHAPGAPALRLGLGPGLQPSAALSQLQALLDGHSFWARGRNAAQLRRMLRGSQAVVTAWTAVGGGQPARLVGFARATSDGVFRAVLWDVVVATPAQGLGIGRRLVEALLGSPALTGVERVYLMTTNSEGFYHQIGFRGHHQQRLLMLERQSDRSSG